MTRADDALVLGNAASPRPCRQINGWQRREILVGPRPTARQNRHQAELSRRRLQGRPRDAGKVRERKAQGIGATGIAKALGIGRASVCRVL
jgi:hypothetical protein